MRFNLKLGNKRVLEYFKEKKTYILQENKNYLLRCKSYKNFGKEYLKQDHMKMVLNNCNTSFLLSLTSISNRFCYKKKMFKKQEISFQVLFLLKLLSRFLRLFSSGKFFSKLSKSMLFVVAKKNLLNLTDHY